MIWTSCMICSARLYCSHHSWKSVFFLPALYWIFVLFTVIILLLLFCNISFVFVLLDCTPYIVSSWTLRVFTHSLVYTWSRSVLCQVLSKMQAARAGNKEVWCMAVAASSCHTSQAFLVHTLLARQVGYICRVSYLVSVFKVCTF